MLQAWTGAPSFPSALVSILLRLPKIKFAIVTLGEDGCIMLERSADGKCSIISIYNRTYILVGTQYEGFLTTMASNHETIIYFHFP